MLSRPRDWAGRLSGVSECDKRAVGRLPKLRADDGAGVATRRYRHPDFALRDSESAWRVLRSYKDGPADSTQQLFRLQVAALLARFIRHHALCIAGATGQQWDTVTVVPSGRARAGEHPLEEALRRATALGALYKPLLVRSGVPLSPRAADDRKYDVTENVHGRRVLLVDDTFTSGSSAQSAASSLQRAGANVVSVLVVGRVIRPEFSDAALRLWTAARRKRFSFETCCLES